MWLAGLTPLEFSGIKRVRTVELPAPRKLGEFSFAPSGGGAWEGARAGHDGYAMRPPTSPRCGATPARPRPSTFFITPTDAGKETTKYELKPPPNHTPPGHAHGAPRLVAPAGVEPLHPLGRGFRVFIQDNHPQIDRMDRMKIRAPWLDPDYPVHLWINTLLLLLLLRVLVVTACPRSAHRSARSSGPAGS